MPSRFESGVYDPEIVKTMSAALADAWARFDPPPGDVELARELLATAIIEGVEAGGIEPRKLADRAAAALRAAIAIEPRLLPRSGQPG